MHSSLPRGILELVLVFQVVKDGAGIQFGKVQIAKVCFENG
jgi:hypothetical protein